MCRVPRPARHLDRLRRVDHITVINQGSLRRAESLRVHSGGYTPQIVPGRNAVWVLTPSGLARADPATGQITAIIHAG